MMTLETFGFFEFFFGLCETEKGLSAREKKRERERERESGREWMGCVGPKEGN